MCFQWASFIVIYLYLPNHILSLSEIQQCINDSGMSPLLCILGMVYFTVEGSGALPGAIKRAYLPAVDDHNNNIAAAINLDIKYITKPYGIAVDWVGR